MLRKKGWRTQTRGRRKERKRKWGRRLEPVELSHCTPPNSVSVSYLTHLRQHTDKTEGPTLT